jgi:hypothetical protein
MTKNSHEIGMQISYGNRQITNIHNTKFLGLMIESSLSWKTHIDVLISKLNKECYAIRSVKPLMSSEVLRMIYFAYVHSVILYGMVFWGNYSHSRIIFIIQKRIISIIMNSSSSRLLS